jgi:hypothetical protein
MANTHNLIASTTVGSGGATSIEFTSIPSTYTDLKLVFSCRTTVSYGGLFYQTDVTINSGVGAASEMVYIAYSSTYGKNNTGALTVYGVSNSDATANSFGNGEIYIPNYAGSSYKSAATYSVSASDAAGAIRAFSSGVFNTTSAVTSIKLLPFAYSGVKFAQYSTAYLYGIKNS